jgi:hypothetical protein
MVDHGFLFSWAQNANFGLLAHFDVSGEDGRQNEVADEPFLN